MPKYGWQAAIAMFWYLFGVSSSGRALDADEAVRRALSRPAFVALLESPVERERARTQANSAYTNPQLAYMREQTQNQLGTSEDYLSLSQQLDLGGRRRLARRGGTMRIEARELERTQRQVALAAEVRQRFYECLYRDARMHALSAWAQQIDAALLVVARRTARGDAAAYDTRRLERELILAKSRVDNEAALSAAAKRQLSALTAAGPDALQLSGALLPNTAPPPLPHAPTLVAGSLDVRMHERSQRAAELEAKSAARMRVPALRVEAGYKNVDLHAGGRTQGFLAGAGLTLPLFDRGTGQRRAADAEARGHEAARQLTREEKRHEVLSVHELATRMREGALHFRSASAAASRDLTRIATAGYEGGELGMFELLDAFRGAVEDELTALDMELAARRALIELDRLAGRGLP